MSEMSFKVSECIPLLHISNDYCRCAIKSLFEIALIFVDFNYFGYDL